MPLYAAYMPRGVLNPWPVDSLAWRQASRAVVAFLETKRYQLELFQLELFGPTGLNRPARPPGAPLAPVRAIGATSSPRPTTAARQGGA